jgi:hypothetical protein
MRVCHIAKSATWIKWLAAGVLLSVLAACGGGSSSSGCIGSECGAPELGTIDAMGTDGPLTFALMSIERLDDWIADAASANLLKGIPVSSNAEGLADDLELIDSAGSGPFVLEVTADTATKDLTTGQAPAVTQVYTIITQSQLQQSPRPRFYATALTTLALDRAVFMAGGAPNQADLDAASVEIINLLGFGLPSGVDIFAISPIFDDSTSTLADQEVTAAYRTALETLAEVLEAAALAADESTQQVFDEVVIEIRESGSIGDPSTTTTANPAIIGDFLTVANSVSPAFLSSSDRFPTPAPESFGNVTDLLVGEAPASSPLDGSPADLNDFIAPVKPDFDGDELPNDVDLDPYDPLVTADDDSDGVDNLFDNCLNVPNLDQANLDGDDFGNVCDNDADGDGVDGDGAGNPGADADDLNASLITDPDGDDVDTNSGLNPAGTANLNGPDNCPVDNNPLQENYDNPDNIVGTADDLIVVLDIGGAPTPTNVADILGNVCDPDGDGDTFEGPFGGGDGTESAVNDLDETAFPGESDGDGVGDLVDNCPFTANADQAAGTTNAVGGAVPFGIACDADDDGYPEPAQDTSATGELGEGVPRDNCPGVANGVALDDQADNDNDFNSAGAVPQPANEGGDACDVDDDNDGIPDVADPAPFVAVSDYHFDIFYTQQSSEAGSFKLATVSESVLQTGAPPAFIDAGSSNTLDLGVDGLGTGVYNVASNYETIESSVDFDQTSCTGVGCFSDATPTALVLSDNIVTIGALGNTANYAEPTLSFASETPPAVLSPWGNSAFVGSGTVTLNVVGSTLGTSAEQGLTALQYTDGLSDAGDLDGRYGFVQLGIDYAYAGGAAVNTALVTTISRVFDATFNGLGAITAEGSLNSFDVSVGNAEGTVSYDTTALGTTAATYTVGADGLTSLIFDTETLDGITDAEGELIVLSDGDTRGYGVKLGTFADTVAAGAAIVGTYDLQGLVVQPGRTRLLAYDLRGATITFSDDGAGNVTAAMSLAGDTRDRALFDAEDDALPSMDTESSPLSGSSNAFVIDPATGRFGPVTWGSGTGLKQFELEGFLVEGKGLLLRYVESALYESGGAGGGGLSFWCGTVPDDLPTGFIEFVDPTTGDAVDPQPTSGYVCGFIQVGAAASRSKVSADAIISSPQVYTTLEGSGATFVEDSFGQGIVWGIPQ